MKKTQRKEIQEKTLEELMADGRNWRQEIFNLRLQQASAQLEKPARLRTLRRDIARIETRMSQLRRQGGINLFVWLKPLLPSDSGPRASAKSAWATVISNKMAKTIVVRVERRFPHPRFKKVVTGYKKLYAHDEKSEAKVGDRVRMEETRPLSKTKRWRLVEIVRAQRRGGTGGGLRQPGADHSSSI